MADVPETGGAPDAEDSGNQLALFDLTDLQMEAAQASLDTTEGEYSGMRLQVHHPRLYNAVVKLLAAGRGVIAIEELLGVGRKTVMAIRDRNAPAIAIEKSKLAEKSHGVAGLALEVAAGKLLDPDEAKKVSFRDLVVGAGIAIDKGQLLAGEATHRVQIRTEEPGHQDYLDTLARVHEVPAEEMDLGRETGEQKGAPPARPALPAGSDDAPGEPAQPLADCPEPGAGRGEDGQGSRQGAEEQADG